MPVANTIQAKNTFHDYLSWPDDARVEIIEGEIFDMGPAPFRRHQEVSVHLITQLFPQLENSGCKIYHAPFDVCLPEKDETADECTTIVQPDVVIVCDPVKLDDRGCKGAPDLVVEITSPASASVDNIKKLNLYEKHGILEYWIVHPIDNIATRRVLDSDGKYGKPEIYDAEAEVDLAILPEVTIKWKSVFEKK